MSHTAGEQAQNLIMRVQRMEWAATDVIELELRLPDGSEIPTYQPGAHIDLELPNGITRSYSIKGDPAQSDRYVVGVGLDTASRGGSKYIHKNMRVGDVINVSRPRNHFPLIETAEKVVLIAGGIGATPMVCMARRLSELGQACQLVYAIRSNDRAAFLTELQALDIDLRLHIDNENGGPINLAEVISDQPKGTHFYCCGPAGMMTAFETATADLPDENIHVEYFAPKVIEDVTEANGFTVVLNKSGKTVEVDAEETVAEAIQAAGVKVDLSCEDGICGTCETRVLEGVPEHRDSVLTKKEQESNRTMMICVSRCAGKRLVLDL
ncbi:PDR/VanB family oxidoreductase [Shimia sediminis]|uniref:PDR/VanB family oxidoreductase n=1 Tax=Shimia sediminis TaxID=2497945 RepID=UPI000F8EAEB7|nr:PDR/VanB family oxidoreductase [Shimia sediminis]